MASDALSYMTHYVIIEGVGNITSAMRCIYHSFFDITGISNLYHNVTSQNPGKLDESKKGHVSTCLVSDMLAGIKAGV